MSLYLRPTGSQASILRASRGYPLPAPPCVALSRLRSIGGACSRDAGGSLTGDQERDSMPSTGTVSNTDRLSVLHGVSRQPFTP